jgi:hypothetical protein
VVNDLPLEEGDGASIVDAARVSIVGVADAELLLFDLP